ncbi:uncharacterized protein LOC108703780 [Xenopus laevis]|uniref:Uncharacterized protein LOC108703780 n=1 Tax=Xenopus laevis TaxID=8355 RepID=A0A8J0U358_XENLA|nr:uncharacterized protein LOC108703780 [Xenopus laevis]
MTTQGEIGNITLSKRPISDFYPIQSRCPSMDIFQELVEAELKEIATNSPKHRRDNISPEERKALKDLREPRHHNPPIGQRRLCSVMNTKDYKAEVDRQLNNGDTYIIHYSWILMDVKSLYSCIPHNMGVHAITEILTNSGLYTQDLIHYTILVLEFLLTHNINLYQYQSAHTYITDAGYKSKRKSTRSVNDKEKIFLVTDYSEKFTAVCKTIKKYLLILYSDSQLKDIISPKDIKFVSRKAPTLGRMLAPSVVSSSTSVIGVNWLLTKGTYKCGATTCKTCKVITISQGFKSKFKHATNTRTKGFSIVIRNTYFTC